ncbi:MAG: hypothetical protein MRZ54_08260 [Clostridiales bacterium]|nr:hypothetical protein [Clostridiales bacterium]
MNAAAACSDRKSTKAWTAYKASVYSMYESALELLQTFGHSDAGLFLILQAQNNGEWFTYYMLGADAGTECTVWDYVTLDEKPVTSDK